MVRAVAHVTTSQEDYPGLWQRVVESSEAGKFIPVGGTWVEMDTNVVSSGQAHRYRCGAIQICDDNRHIASSRGDSETLKH